MLLFALDIYVNQFSLVRRAKVFVKQTRLLIYDV